MPDTLKHWNGFAWVAPSTLKHWNGSAWLSLNTLKHWNGFAWLPLSAASGGVLRASDFYHSMGVMIHTTHTDTIYADTVLLKTKLSALGIKHVRDGVQRWNDPAADEYYQGVWDELINNAGVRLNLILDPRQIGNSPMSQDLLEWAYALVYGGIDCLEGPNEYDHSGDAAWISVLKAYQLDLFNAARASSLTNTLPVIAPSLVESENFTSVGNITDRIDLSNAHPYFGGLMPEGPFLDTTLTNTSVIGPGKGVAFSESGYHTAINWNFGDYGHPPVNENTDAKYTMRMFLEYFRRGVVRTYRYEFFDGWADPALTSMESNFGLVRQDGTEKPSFGALKNLIAHFADTPPAGFKPSYYPHTVSGGDADLRKMLFGRSDGKYIFAFWVAKSSWNTSTKTEITVAEQSVNLSFQYRPASVSTYLPKTSSAAQNTYTQPTSISLSVPDHPLIVVVTP